MLDEEEIQDPTPLEQSSSKGIHQVMDRRGFMKPFIQLVHSSAKLLEALFVLRGHLLDAKISVSMNVFGIFAESL